MEQHDTEQNKIKQHSRSEVIRDTFVLQLKLIVDGFRDLMLMPVVLIASLSGLLLHKRNPGRYMYRLLSYGKISEHWIGLFDEATKDNLKPIDLKDNSFDELLKRTQSAIESKYINEEKKQNLINKLNKTLDDINTKMNPKNNNNKN